MTFDELHTAWAELDQLEGEEKHLTERLSVVHEKIKAHKAKIDILVKGRPPSINRLPLELLSQILVHSTLEPEFPERSFHAIACVSRRWRDVVLYTPTFWTSITVTPHQQLYRLRRQLKRSYASRLDIWITGWRETYALEASLDMILPHSINWRTLTVSKNGIEATNFIFQKIFLREFPSLRAISVDSVSGGYVVPSFPLIALTSLSPALRHLTLTPPFPWNKHAQSMCSTLRTLDFTLPEAIPSPVIVKEFASSQSLTLLILSGDDGAWSLKRDTLHFPLLEELRLRINRPTSFLEAIIAPRLEYVECTPYYYPMFSTIEGKFCDVGHLHFAPRSFNTEDVVCLRRAFPAVRHVDLSIYHGFYFEGAQPPIDQWQNLETVTIYDLGRWWPDKSIERDRIVEWLRERQESGRPQLSVRLPGTRINEPEKFHLLRRYCNLELLT